MVDIFNDPLEGGETPSAAPSPGAPGAVDIFSDPIPGIKEPNKAAPSTGFGLSDMHREGTDALGRAWSGLTSGFTIPDPTKGMGLEDYLRTGKELGRTIGSAIALPFSYPAGAAVSAIGQPMAAAGEYLERNLFKSSSPRSQQEIYEEMKPGVETALGAVARTPRSLTGLQGPGLTRFEPIQPKETPVKSGIIRDNLRLLTEEGQKTRAGQILEKSATDPEALREALGRGGTEIVPGSEPTTFQATGDMGIGNLERAATASDPAKFNIRRGEQNEARIEALRGAQSTGDAEAVSAHLRDSFRAADNIAEEGERAAQQTAWDVQNRLGGAVDPQTAGNIIRHELQRAEQARRVHENELWSAVDPEGNGVFRTNAIQSLRDNIYHNMSPAAQTTITAKERELADLIGSMGRVIPFREAADLRGALSAAMREERGLRGSTPAYGRMVRMRVALEDAITRDVMDMATQEFSAAFQQRLGVASAATRERAQTFGQAPLKEILRREGLEGPYRLQTGAVLGKIVRPGASGYDGARAFIEAVGQREGLPVLRDSIVATMRREVIGQNGRIDPGRLSSWMGRYDDVLRLMDRFDGGRLRQSLSNAETAARSIADTAAVRARIADDHNAGIFGRLINATDKEDISRIIGGIFGRIDSVAQARALRQRMTTPAALDGAKKAISDYVQEKFISNTGAAGSEESLIRADQFQTFMRKNMAALREFGFTPEQLHTWGAIADDIRRANRSISATKIPGGSNTAQDLYAMRSLLPHQMTPLEKIIVYGAGSALTAAAHMTHALPVIGELVPIIGAHFAMALRDAGIKTVQDLINRAMLDPALARDLLQKTRGTPRPRGMKGYSMYQASTANLGD